MRLRAWAGGAAGARDGGADATVAAGGAFFFWRGVTGMERLFHGLVARPLLKDIGDARAKKNPTR